MPFFVSKGKKIVNLNVSSDPHATVMMQDFVARVLT
jgi:hypothetical protein